MVDLSEIVYIVLVATLWGATNPMLRYGSKGVEKIKRKTWLLQLLGELWFLIKNWKYTVPLIINQSGSVFYTLLVAKVDLSLAVPVVNALTFFFTIVVGCFYGEKMKENVVFGSFLVLLGVTLCIVDKL